MMRAKALFSVLRSFLWVEACNERPAMRTIPILFIAWVAAMPTAAFAAEFGSEIEGQALRNAALSDGFQTDYIVQVLLSLLVVVGVIVLLSFLVKKLNLQSRTGAGAVRILSVVPIGAKDKLLLVEVGDEQLLLGSSPGNVQKLHLLEKPIVMNSKSDSISAENGFLSVLSSARRGQQA